MTTPTPLHSSTGRGEGMCLRGPAAAVGHGASGGGRRPGLPGEHHHPVCQGQPLLWPVGKKSTGGSTTSQTRYHKILYLRPSNILLKMSSSYQGQLECLQESNTPSLILLVTCRLQFRPVVMLLSSANCITPGHVVDRYGGM